MDLKKVKERVVGSGCFDRAENERIYRKFFATVPRSFLYLVDKYNLGEKRVVDVGCGYGGLYTHALQKGLTINYTGIDVAGNMIKWATANVPGARFITGDVLANEFDDKFDYVVCNGILTQKLQAPGLEMDRFAAKLIRRLFELCRRGIAFNVMTTKVNHFANNLYYRNPAELFSWCLSEITPHIRLDHAYPLYEYTMYLYREPHAESS